MLQLQLLHCLPVYPDILKDTSTSLSIFQMHSPQPCRLSSGYNKKSVTRLLCVGLQDMVSSTMVEQGMLDHH